ncbi:hypothetical protein [Dulcicalothrix desertica]|uniref:hypothetical protein n=1 Tax=Dulcicalothrix desertica TaxID=32056 RepID=UPI00119B64C3|nr:hypothetical protein [Dulcicalothrix desertica]TWH62672.1 hypothetical protein CAL7102_00179 [Dulcicalothrix desertica PCC 7102]
MPQLINRRAPTLTRRLLRLVQNSKCPDSRFHHTQRPRKMFLLALSKYNYASLDKVCVY